jgi:serine/threonine protein kinase
LSAESALVIKVVKPEDWQKFNEIVLDALALDRAVREKFVEDACAGSPEMRIEAKSLLKGELGADNFFESPAAISYAGFFGKDEEPEALVGQKIGNYQIEREIGGGGMGAVYLATRTDGKFAQRVAVKMLRREFNVGKIRRRFNVEKEIQAKLSHPNIARLIDAGMTGDGVPYLVMEYIEGEPIDVFCRENALALNERLKLFNRICDAVTFAHRNLIIHRDLKPSNILVTKDGKPKLLDFGISKLLDAQATSDEHTTTLLGAMTPQYASPEQIRGASITTATDIYSLGVILFKILTDNFPYDFKNKTNGNLLKTITDTEAISPSAAVIEAARRGDAADELYDSRKISASPSHQVSASELRGDLDNIILKSLSKEPERRYQTVEHFSADIWRFIDGLPVQARPNTFSYRASKFYGRNKVPVLAAALILISLFVGFAVAVSQANAARTQARIASEARAVAEIETEHAKSEQDKARAEEEKAKKISRFMSKVISYANPAWYAEGGRFEGEVKLIDVLDDLGEKIDREFAGQPDIQSELHHKFTEVYNFYKTGARAEGARVKGLYHAKRALELRKQHYGEHHELVAKDMFYLVNAGAVESGEANDEKFAKTLATAIQMMRETNPKNLNLPYMLSAYANRLTVSDVEPYRETYLKLGISPPTDVEKFNETYRRAAIPPTGEDKYQLAERYYKEALLIYWEHYKKLNYAIVLDECNLAFVLIKQNKRAEFEEHYQICKQNWGNYPSDPANPKSVLDFIEEVLASGNR